MAEVFTIDDVAARAQKPNLSGDFTPGLDNAVLDGRKVVIPWGGGDNQKRYLTGMDGLYTPESDGSGELYNGITLADLIQMNQEGLLGRDGRDGTSGQDGTSAASKLTAISQYAAALAQAGGFSLGLPGPAGPNGANGDAAKYIQVHATSQVFLTQSGEAVTPSTIELSVTLVNIAAPSYQWQYHTGSAWADIAGAVLSTYTVNPTDFIDERTYQLKVSKDGINYYDTMTLIHLFDGTNGTNGVDGVDGAGIVYYIQPTDGTAIHNGEGTLTIEAHKIEDSIDAILTTGTIQLYNPSNTALGYSETFGASAINDSIIITLKSGPTEDPMDTITLIDITDGVNGDPGTPGTSSTVYYILPTEGTALKNGVGTLTLEAHKIENNVDTIISTGAIKLYDESDNLLTEVNGYEPGSNGYTGILDAGDIDGSILITMKSGIGEDVLDTITLVDILDGASVNPAVYYIKDTNGAMLVPGGDATLTIEARKVQNSSDSLLSSGDIKLYDSSNNEITEANGYVEGSDGYTGIFDTGDIDGGLEITLKEGVDGTPLDLITLIDVTGT